MSINPPTTAVPTDEDVRDALVEMQAQGQGVWVLDCYSADILPGLIAAGASDSRAEALLALFGQVADRILEAPADQPMLCLTCEFAFGMVPGHMPARLAILKPSVPQPCGAVVQGICEKCCERDTASLQVAVLDAVAHYTGIQGMRRFADRPAGHA